MLMVLNNIIKPVFETLEIVIAITLLFYLSRISKLFFCFIFYHLQIFITCNSLVFKIMASGTSLYNHLSLC